MLDRAHDSPLLNYYYNNQKESLLNAILEIMESGGVPPLDDMFHILAETEDVEILGLSLELLYLNHETFQKQLFAKFNESDSDRLKLWILVVLCIQPNETTMYFIVEIYIKHEEFRPHIAKTAFKQKIKMFMGLTRYVEITDLSEDDEQIVLDLLETVPRSTIMRIGGGLGMLKIMDYYYKVPPNKRRQD
ncbi:MAG: hypothetical protein O3A01_00705 [bacterium]|nr:hypothetical protein [bacterium]